VQAARGGVFAHAFEHGFGNVGQRYIVAQAGEIQPRVSRTGGYVKDSRFLGQSAMSQRLADI